MNVEMMGSMAKRKSSSRKKSKKIDPRTEEYLRQEKDAL